MQPMRSNYCRFSFRNHLYKLCKEETSMINMQMYLEDHSFSPELGKLLIQRSCIIEELLPTIRILSDHDEKNDYLESQYSEKFQKLKDLEQEIDQLLSKSNDEMLIYHPISSSNEQIDDDIVFFCTSCNRVLGDKEKKESEAYLNNGDIASMSERTGYCPVCHATQSAYSVNRLSAELFILEQEKESAINDGETPPSKIIEICNKIIEKSKMGDPFYADVYGEACICRAEAYRSIITILEEQEKYDGIMHYCEEMLKSFEEGRRFGGFFEPEEWQEAHYINLLAIIYSNSYDNYPVSYICDEVETIESSGEKSKQIYKENYPDYYAENAANCDQRTIRAYIGGAGILDSIHAPVNQIDEYIEKARSLIQYNDTISKDELADLEQYLPQKVEQHSDKKGCYIATCAYGSYNCPELWTFRRYRDERLMKSDLGKLIVSLYYYFSPRIVRAFGNNAWFVRGSKQFLDRLYLHLKKKGYSDLKYIDE